MRASVKDSAQAVRPDTSPIRFDVPATTAAIVPVAYTGDWRAALPMLAGERVALRELRRTDAVSLLTMLTTEEVTRFISPPPTTVGEFERFIEWTHRERAAGNQFCFGVQPTGYSSAMGLIQIRQVMPHFHVAEWGFALGSPFWGSGIFMDGARLVLDFTFQKVGVHRVEARAATPNVRGNGVLRKLGAVQEGILRQSLLRNGLLFDQIMWSILAADWLQAKAIWGVKVC